MSRKNVLPVFEENNGLLFYPVQYEGNECSKNVVYSGARAEPAEPAGGRVAARARKAARRRNSICWARTTSSRARPT